MMHPGAQTDGRPPTPCEVLAAHRGDLADLVVAHRLTNVRVFGSVARGEDVTGSDLDLLVTRAPGVGLLALAELTESAECLLGVEVDVVTDGGLPAGHEVLEAAVVV